MLEGEGVATKAATSLPPTAEFNLDPAQVTDPAMLGLPPIGPPAKLFVRRDQMAPGAIRGEGGTLGWDTVFAIRLPDVNAALEKADYPKKFHLDVDPEEGWAIDGTFGPWRLTTGGSGEIVFLQIPVVTGTMTRGKDTYPLDGATIYVSVKLRFVPQPPKAGWHIADGRVVDGSVTDGHVTDGSGRHPLRGADVEVDDLVTNPERRSEQDPPAVVQNLTIEPKPKALIYALMKDALQQWFNANLAQFTHVFSTVSLNARAAAGQFQWLSPTYTSYAYSNDPGGDENKCYFGVLCMVEDASPSGNRNVLSDPIPAGQRAGFSISMKRFLEKLVLPGLPKSFVDASVSDFTLNRDGTVIAAIRPVRMEDVKVNGISYTPWVQSFELQVVGDEIQVHSLTKVEVSPGIRAMVDNTSYLTIVVVDKPDGTQTLDFKPSREAVTNHWIDKDIGIDITLAIIALVAAVAGGVALKVIEPIVYRILAIILIAIVAGLAAAIPALIAAVAGGGAAKALPPLDLVVSSATDPIVWPGASKFRLTSAGLNGSFQLGGNPGFNAG